MYRLPIALLAVAASLAAAEADFFEAEVRPLLAAKCYACHTDSRMGGLRLDSRTALLEGGSRGAAVVPGDPEASLLLRAVERTSDDLKMPPTEPLSPEEVGLLTRWVADGAFWPESSPVVQTNSPDLKSARSFWSLVRVQRPPVPRAEGATPIDRFLLAKLREAGLEPAPAADKRTLIRRATLDLLGLPPTPGEVEAFLADASPDAYERVIDRLLESPHYGERMARRWLDLARYADGRSSAFEDEPLPNAWRYRDWVVSAFNQDLPYDEFTVAQLAADLLPDGRREEHLPALGFHALRDRDDDRVDVTSRVFLGLTVGCAQCHDHKFDPIPQSDFYALQGVFDSTEEQAVPLAPAEQVEAYKAAQEKVARQKLEIDVFLEKERDLLVDVLMERTSDYLLAVRSVHNGASPAEAAADAGVDAETLGRWIEYLDRRPHDHPYLDDWLSLMDAGGGSEQKAVETAQAFAETLGAIHREKRAVDDRNYVKLGGAAGVRDQKTLLATNLEFLDPVRYYLWRDLATAPGKKHGLDFAGGVYFYDGEDLDRWLGLAARLHLERERAELAELKRQVPDPYPFIHACRDADEPKNARIAIRGDKSDLGDEAPRRFLTVLSAEKASPFAAESSGRLELARAIAAPDNPLTARVFVNRLWQWRFGRALVATPSNFGQLGERPTHPELLDWLAGEFIEGGWSVKTLDRMILLSDAYRRSSRVLEANLEADASNLLLWRFNPVDRLDAESLRDSMLSVSGRLDRSLGGPSQELTPDNRRRAIYGTVARTSPDRTMTLLDFPDPKTHAEQRNVTVGPLQRLFLLNNPFVIAQSEAMAARLEREAGAAPDARIRLAYELLYSRAATAGEIAAGVEFVATETWPRYLQALLASSEFLTVR